jgi:hypothetical protein
MNKEEKGMDNIEKKGRKVAIDIVKANVFAEAGFYIIDED